MFIYAKIAVKDGLLLQQNKITEDDMSIECKHPTHCAQLKRAGESIVKHELRIKELEQQNKELKNLMLEMADYLNRNKLNYIGSGSIFNQQMNDILNKLK